MANAIIKLPTGYFPDPDRGRPLFNAKIYIGEPDLDPRVDANQKTVTGRREDGTEVALEQPIRTNNGGVPIDGSSNVVVLLVDGAYSMAVDDRQDNQKYYFDNVFEGAPVTFNDNPILYRDTVAIAVADESLSVGQYVTTKGYTNVNDGGGADYVVVAGGTGTDDGGSYIDLDNGNQLEQIINDRLNLKTFGAIGDGSTDDSSAVSAWLKYGIDNKLAMRVPLGEYLLDTQVTYSSSSIQFDMEGDGREVSTFISNNSTGAISIVNTSRDTNATIQDLGFRAGIKSAGIGLRLIQPTGGNRHNRSIVMRSVRFSVVNENDSANYGYWATACDLEGCWRPYIDSLIVSGPFGPGITDDLSDSSPLYVTNAGLNIDECYGPEIHNSYIWSCNVGISNKSSEDPGPEGFRMQTTNIVEVRTALEFERPSQEPTIWITDCHYNYRDRGLEIIGSKLIIIKGCIPYNVDINQEFGGTPEDIYLDNTSVVTILGNQFHFDGNPARRIITIVATTAADDILISNNFFNAEADIGIALGSNVSNCLINNNEFTGNITTEVSDSSNGATIIGVPEGGTVELESGAESATKGPVYSLYRNSGTPTNNDVLGTKDSYGNNDAITKFLYSSERTRATNVAAGSETSAVDRFISIDGSPVNSLTESNPDASDSCTLSALFNVGGTLDLRRVLIGAADSGGTGYRLLRILN